MHKSKIRASRIVELYYEGFTTKQIAAILKYKTGTVTDKLRAAVPDYQRNTGCIKPKTQA